MDTNEPSNFKIVPEDHPFVFKKLCPYCKGNLTYVCNGWEQDDNGLWMADSFDMECSKEPNNVEAEEWEFWIQQHSEMPYVYQLPVDEKVKAFINRKYRFDLK